MSAAKLSNAKDEFSGPDGETLRRIVDAFLDHLVAARTAIGINQSELAKRAGLAPGHMSNIETGRRGITLPTFVRIARGLGMRPSELAVYLGALPVAPNATDGATVVAVVTDGTVRRDSLHDALGELRATETVAAKVKSKRHDPRAKTKRTQKHR